MRFKFIILLTTIFCSLGVAAQSAILYYELEDGSDGHFIAVNSKSCYDCDRNGVSLDNGTRLFVSFANFERNYFGMSYFGDALYAFSADYKVLKIKCKSSGKTMTYYRKKAPADAVSAHGTPPELKKQDVYIPKIYQSMYPEAYSPIYPSTNSGTTNSTSTQTHRPCAGCGGSGRCSMCQGKGWYTYQGSSHRCPSCNGTGTCKVCHGKGHCH